MKRFLSLLFSFFCLLGFSQTAFHNAQTELKTWEQAICSNNSANTLKTKNINFPQKYSIDGYFKKGMLLEGSIATITYTSPQDSSIILRGRVLYQALQLVITGVKDSAKTRTYGSFYIWNSNGREMSYNPKKAGELTIVDKEVKYHTGYYRSTPIIVALASISKIYLDGEFGVLSAELSSSMIKKYGYTDLRNLVKSIDKNVFIEYKDGSRFYGDIQTIMQDDGKVFFHQTTGRLFNNPQGWKEIIVHKEGKEIKVQLIDNKENNLLKKETLFVPISQDIPQYPIEHISRLYELMNRVKWEYRNGDSFEGEASTVISPVGNISTKITRGKYSYSNGDSFIGDLSGNHFYGLPVDGITYFKNGTSQKGNWIADNYDLTKKQYTRLSELRFPSIIRDSAIVFHNNNLYNGYISAAKQSELEKKYTLAKQYYQKAQELKPDAEKWEDKMKELDKSIKEEKRRKSLVAKYGAYVGNKLFG